ncbi:MAG TPA: TetR/AcrR family transcriptional regulator [Ideonella sp.]|uniref:TetR/AcrR family transcriptional regulator n=1 Tax=Ideonella sp. TaxID=1929293 RepID=UPI002CB25AF7|nr:TetR/AcrR family transcriptional regulator [Ideonella sp.]HSI51615.1 TetR/AcrR family transcriptional regulator [Ideonella sp.]
MLETPTPPPAPSLPISPAGAALTPRYQEKREAILAGAAALFNERGVKGATLADIAGSVGLVTNSVTYYYRKKEELATACFMRTLAAYNGLIVQAASAAGPEARVRALLRGHAELLAAIETGQHPPVLSFNDVRALPSPQMENVFEAYSDMYRRLRALLQGPETQALSRDELNARAHSLLSHAHWLRSWIDRYEPEEYTRIAERVADTLLHGMAAPGSVWRAAGDEREWPLAEGAAGRSEALDAFLRAATFLVNEQGYRGASVDKISARLHVTKGSFYHHNDNKQDLISACFERSFGVLRQALQRAESGPGSGWDRACAAARALTSFQLSARGPLLRSSATSALPDAVQRDKVRRTMHRLAERMACVVVDGMMDGSIRPLDPAIAAQAAIALINATGELRRWVPTVDAGSVADLYVRPLFTGLLCPAAA